VRPEFILHRSLPPPHLCGIGRERAPDDLTAHPGRAGVCQGPRSKLGGHRKQSDISKAEAVERAQRLAPVMAELSGLSARAAAEELNRRGIPTASGGRWQAVQVIRVRERLA
jgi:hypothetical protein